MNELIERLELATLRLQGIDPEELHGDFDRQLLAQAKEIIISVRTELAEGYDL